MTAITIQSYIDTLKRNMLLEEKSSSTIELYLRVAKKFLLSFAGDSFDQQTVLEFKNSLSEQYAPSSIQTMLTALNYFLRHIGRSECRVRVQAHRQTHFRDDMRELSAWELRHLLDTAEKEGKTRLVLAICTLAFVGLRVSELKYVTVEAVRHGSCRVTLKRRTREIVFPNALAARLLDYAYQQGISSGCIFVTRTGNPIDRSNLWHEMKMLAKKAGIAESRVFPHNMRHFFAVRFYTMTNDLVHLADILGHANVNTTRIYTAVTIGKQRKQMDALYNEWDKLFLPPAEQAKGII